MNLNYNPWKIKFEFSLSLSFIFILNLYPCVIKVQSINQSLCLSVSLSLSLSLPETADENCFHSFSLLASCTFARESPGSRLNIKAVTFLKYPVTTKLPLYAGQKICLTVIWSLPAILGARFYTINSVSPNYSAERLLSF